MSNIHYWKEMNLSRPTIDSLKMIVAGKQDPSRFNLLVIGESGLGKTTFLQTILQKFIPRDLLNFEDERTTVNISETGNFTVESDVGSIHFYLYDSPGYGDHINNQFSFDLIKQDLVSRHDSWRNLDAQLLTEEERLSLDTRIHCVLYFISPNRIKVIDGAFLEHIHELAPIVPVVAKADSMTPEELSVCLKRVHNAITGIHTSNDVIYNFAEDPSSFELLHTHGNGLHRTAATPADLNEARSSRVSSCDSHHNSINSNRPQERSRSQSPDIEADTMFLIGSSLSDVDLTFEVDRMMGEEEEMHGSVCVVQPGGSGSHLPPRAVDNSTNSVYKYCMDSMKGLEMRDNDYMTDPTVPATHDGRCDSPKNHTGSAHHDNGSTASGGSHGNRSPLSRLSQSMKAYQAVPNIFAIIAHPSMVRRYRWGCVDVEDESISDFRRLRKLLFEDGKHIRGMKKVTQQMTMDRYRNKLPSYPQSSDTAEYGRRAQKSVSQFFDCFGSFLTSTLMHVFLSLVCLAGIVMGVWALPYMCIQLSSATRYLLHNLQEKNIVDLQHVVLLAELISAFVGVLLFLVVLVTGVVRLRGAGGKFMIWSKSVPEHACDGSSASSFVLPHSAAIGVPLPSFMTLGDIQEMVNAAATARAAETETSAASNADIVAEVDTEESATTASVTLK